MKKINKSGFALVETLIVAVFVVTIFTMIFTNIYPLIGTYEQVENYDDVDGKYAAYWIKTIIQDTIKLSTVEPSIVSGKYYYEFDCSKIPDDIEYANRKTICSNLMTELSIKKAYITKYNLTSLKSSINNGTMSEGLKKYIKYQPNFSKASTNQKYRVIIEMDRKEKDNEDSNEEDPFIAYATMEVSFK